jgi:hypothetical protein
MEVRFRISGIYVLKAKNNRPSLFTGPYFTVSQIRSVAPRTKNLSLSPFNGEGHQNRSKTLTGFRSIPHDVQGVAGKNETVPIVSVKKRKIPKNTKIKGYQPYAPATFTPLEIHLVLIPVRG